MSVGFVSALKDVVLPLDCFRECRINIVILANEDFLMDYELDVVDEPLTLHHYSSSSIEDSAACYCAALNCSSKN